MDTVALAESIHRVFEPASAVPWDRITDCSCPECWEIRDSLRGLDWHSLSSVRRHLLNRLSNQLCLLSTEAFIAYYPAILLVCVQDEEMRDDLADAAFSALERGERIDVERLGAFSRTQLEVVLDVLGFLFSKEPTGDGKNPYLQDFQNVIHGVELFLRGETGE